MSPVPPKFQIDIAKLDVANGNNLRALKPDPSGKYKMPIFVLDSVSRNNAYYDPQSVINCHTNPNMKFYKSVQEKNLEGEWMHPMDDSLKRIVKIDRTLTSHIVWDVMVEPSLDGRAAIIYGIIKPFGPFGDELIKSFADPDVNTAFSIRSVVSPMKVVDGVQHKYMRGVVTYDACDGPGFEQCSKRFAPHQTSTESFSLDYMLDDSNIDSIRNDVIGTESITNESILEMFGTDNVSILSKSYSDVNVKSKSLTTLAGEKEGIFHSMYNY